MLSDEEKEAKLELNRYIYGKNLSKDEIVDYLGIIFALIEKQQKEIEEAEQKEKKAYIDGTNVAHELCNKKWQDKIKAEIEEQKNMRVDGEVFTTSVNYAIKVLQSLLEKEQI